MKISALISTYNRREALLRTIEALLAQSYPLADIELVVLDDAGTDGTFEELQRRKAGFLALGLRGFRALRNETNKGIAYGRGRLTAEAAADSEALLYLDDDVYLEKGTLALLAGRLESESSAGLAGPRLVYASEPGRTAHAANFVGRWSGRYRETDPDSQTDCDWLNSTCYLARRRALEGVKYAEEFYTAHEEVDFCLQLRRAGWRVLYCPEARALHDLPLSGGGRRGRLYYLYRNKLLLFRRNFPPLRRLTATLVMLCLGLPLYLLESLRYNGGVNAGELGLIFRALADGLAGRGGRISGPV